jgi:hypothetical protein
LPSRAARGYTGGDLKRGRKPMRTVIALMVCLAVVAGAAGLVAQESPVVNASQPEWSIQTSIIEACSCTMFCQCYFNTKPSPRAPGCCGDADGLFCKFNNAFKVKKGNYGGTSLDGVKFWVTGDLGGDFSKGEMDHALVIFDKAMSKEQRDGVTAILGHVYPVRWQSFKTTEANIDVWEFNKDAARAAIDGGKTAEVKLKRNPGNTDEPVVIHNLKYWGVPRNEGFVLMPNEVNAFRTGERPFEFKGTNGFMITFDMSSKDVVAPKSAGSGY